MRHCKHRHQLGVKKEHRIALLANLAAALFVHNRIKTTLPKAKALRPFAEKVITLAKKAAQTDDRAKKLHFYRLALAKVRSEEAVAILFTKRAQEFLNRNGGYTRIYKLAIPRIGDVIIASVKTATPGGETTQPEKPETPDVDYKLTIALMNSSLSVGDKVFADVNTIPATAADDLTFTFKSSDTSVVTVKASSRNHFSCDITAVGPGTAIITATDSNGVTATRTITVTGSSSNPGTSTTDDYVDVKDEIIALTNEVRAENNAGSLSKSNLLMQIAQQRANESAEMQTIDHGRPNGDFYDTIFAEYGLDIYSMNYQEILCWGPTDSVDAVMEAWVNSQGHFKSMTNPNMIFVGVGVAKGDNGYYFCQIFTNKDRT